MTYQWDELSKALADDSLPRRQSLRWLGAALAGSVLGPFGAGTAWAGKQDPCQTFCNRCSNKTQRNQCLAACQACNGNTSRLGGSCGSYTCCPGAVCNGACSDLRSNPNCGACGNDCRVYGETCCGNYCADLANDFDNCGRCGAPCDDPGPFEYGACVAGACVYECVEGAIDCGDGTCTYLGNDPHNCGACGNVCPATTPICYEGTCMEKAPVCPGGQTWCSGACYDLYNDSGNCGTSCADRKVCGQYENCTGGACVPND